MNCVFDSVFRVKVKVKAWIGYRVHPIYTYMYSICVYIHVCMMIIIMNVLVCTVRKKCKGNRTYVQVRTVCHV